MKIMKKEITWNNEQWIVDYSTQTIYKEGNKSNNDPNLVPEQIRIGNYSFIKIHNIIYFNNSDKYYKITNDKVEQINKEDYENELKELENAVRKMLKKEITWNNEQWIADYITKTIYKEDSKNNNDPNLVPEQIRIGNFPFKIEDNTIYFKTLDKYYKITNKKVEEIKKEDYKPEFIKLNRNNTEYVENYVISSMIDEIFKSYYKINTSTKKDPKFVFIISNKIIHNLSLYNTIKSIVTEIIKSLPYIEKSKAKEKIKSELSKIIEDNKTFYDKLFEHIYNINKDIFDQYANVFREDIEIIKQQKEKINYIKSLGYTDDEIIKLKKRIPTIFISYSKEEIIQKLENLKLEDLKDGKIENMITNNQFTSSDYKGDQNRRKK